MVFKLWCVWTFNLLFDLALLQDGFFWFHFWGLRPSQRSEEKLGLFLLVFWAWKYRIDTAEATLPRNHLSIFAFLVGVDLLNELEISLAFRALVHLLNTGLCIIGHHHIKMELAIHYGLLQLSKGFVPHEVLLELVLVRQLNPSVDEVSIHNVASLGIFLNDVVHDLLSHRLLLHQPRKLVKRHRLELTAIL